MNRAPLPIDVALPALAAALEAHPRAVLVAPPGAGKTTRVPLDLIDARWLGANRIVMLEPRRLAARQAANRLAQAFSEKPGHTVGLRARLMTETSPNARIEVVTEGVFTRQILDDPELTGVGLVIFDEFHERSLDADFGLALALDAQAALREDLRILIMSATLDGARIASCLGSPAAPCPVITSEGRAYPIETHYLGRTPGAVLDAEILRATNRALRETSGSILVFLPGQGEIRRAERTLGENLPAAAAPRLEIAPLYGAMERDAQDRAIAPRAPGVRKIILATAIAETSLTLEGITAVIDAGLAREPRYDIGARLTRLATVRVSRASADQRRGRAGRLGPGHCYRLWSAPETQSLSPFAVPEILSTDLAGLVLDCAAWGVIEPSALTWLDPPPAAAWAAARADLETLGALDATGRLTSFGAAVRALPLPPVLAAMIARAAPFGQALDAARIAALLVERGLGGTATDLDDRLDRFLRDQGHRARAMRDMAARWARLAATPTLQQSTSAPAIDPGPHPPTGRAPPAKPLSTAALLALAYPDRIAKARGPAAATRGGSGAPYLMSGGSGGALPDGDPLRSARFLVAADLQGTARHGRITSAARLDEAELASIAGDRIEARLDLAFDRTAMAVRARSTRRLGALVLDSDAVPLPADADAAAILANGIAAAGLHLLPWSRQQTELRARVAFLRVNDALTWPDLSDAALARSIDTWLTPFLTTRTALRDITAGDLAAGLAVLLDWNLTRLLDARAPPNYTAPTGNNHPVSYTGEHAPSIALRVQELFGLQTHPSIDAGRLPLTLILLSPAARPIQVTRDLPGFWAGSWSAVRADLRGRYPKHPWPEDPATAPPTARAKPKGRS